MKANPKWCSQQLTLASSSKKAKVVDVNSVDTETASVPTNEKEYLDVEPIDLISKTKLIFYGMFQVLCPI